MVWHMVYRSGYPSGAVTAFALNVKGESESLQFSDAFAKLSYDLYLMSAGEGTLLSQYVHVTSRFQSQK